MLGFGCSVSHSRKGREREGMPGGCSSPAKGSTKAWAPRVGRRRRRSPRACSVGRIEPGPAEVNGRRNTGKRCKRRRAILQFLLGRIYLFFFFFFCLRAAGGSVGRAPGPWNWFILSRFPFSFSMTLGSCSFFFYFSFASNYFHYYNLSLIIIYTYADPLVKPFLSLAYG